MKEFTECCTVIAEGEIIKESLNRLGRDDRLAASPAAAAGDRFCGGGLLGDQRWGGSGAAHDLVIGGWAKVWYNNEEKIKMFILKG